MQRRKKKRAIGWVMAAEQVVQRRPQAVDIRLRGRLRLAVLLRRGITRRAKRYSISGLAGLEVARNAKIDQINISARRHHDISGLEVAKDNRRLARVQVIDRKSRLHTH